MQIGKLLEKWSREQPDKVYLYYEEQEITYQQLFKNVGCVAQKLAELGIKRGDRVALFLKNSPEFLYAWFGLNIIGAVMVPINPAFKQEETTYVLGNSGSCAIIAESDSLENIILPAVDKCPAIEWIAAKGDSPHNKIIPFEHFLTGEQLLKTEQWPEEDLAAILYTSGTTGNPKGVMCPHRYYTVLGQICKQWIGLTPSDRLLTLLPLFHMNAQTTSTMGSLTAGASLILLNGFNPFTFWKDISRYKATIFNYLGAMLPILSKLPVTPEESSHQVRLAVGAQADPNLIESYEKRWGVTMLELFGMTEIGGTCNPISARRIGSCGLPFPGHRLKIVDEEGKEIGVRQTGELMISGPSITLGYWQNPEETYKTYIDGWVLTGDMAYVDEDGYLYFVARKKDIIRRSGENISAVEVENVIMSHPQVLEAAAIAVPDPVRDEEVKVYIVLKEKQTPSTVPPEEIIAWCQERMAKFKIPRYIEYRNELPKTATQKIQKAILRTEKSDLTKDVWDRFANQ